MQIGAFRIKVSGCAQFGYGGFQFMMETQGAAKGAVGFGCAGREFDGDARFLDRLTDDRFSDRGIVFLRQQRVGQIDVRVDEVCVQLECGAELLNRFIDLAAGHQHPA